MQVEMQPIGVHHQHSLQSRLAWLLLFLLALTGICSAREKKDVIKFANGDRITCEIIKLEKGYLYVKLEYADGTVAMDSSKIARVASPQSFVVADKAGKRYTGSLQSVVEGKAPEELEQLQVQVTGASYSQVVASKEVVEIHRTD